MKFRYAILSLFACVILSVKAHAQDVALFRGGNDMLNDFSHTTFAWQIQFMEPLTDHFGFQYAYMNQGHFADHHRDGYVFSFETHTQLFSPRLTFSAALGPYLFADTLKDTPNRDVHGVGAVLSLGAKYEVWHNWFLEAETDVTKASTFNALGVQLGAGYHFGDAAAVHYQSTEEDEEVDSKNQLSLMAGQTIVNVIGNGRSIVTSLEYRRNVWNFVDVSVAAINEGKNALIDRYGMAPEVWVHQKVLHDRLTFSIGGGPYIARDTMRMVDGESDSKPFVGGIFSMSADYAIGKNWGLRATWHRVFTNYNRDTDLIMGGAYLAW